MFIKRSRATTIRPKNGVYQANTRIDPITHERLKYLKAYYKKLTGLSANSGSIMRRAVLLLTDHISELVIKERQGTIPSGNEERILRHCAAGEEAAKQYQDPLSLVKFPTWQELKHLGGRRHQDYHRKSLND